MGAHREAKPTCPLSRRTRTASRHTPKTDRLPPIDIDPATCYFDDMVFLLKSLLIALTAVAVFAPAAFDAGCEDDHASECEEICACICHAVVAKPDAADGILTIPSETSSARPNDELSRGTMLSAEIFRPPLCA